MLQTKCFKVTITHCKSYISVQKLNSLYCKTFIAAFKVASNSLQKTTVSKLQIILCKCCICAAKLILRNYKSGNVSTKKSTYKSANLFKTWFTETKTANHSLQKLYLCYICLSKLQILHSKTIFWQICKCLQTKTIYKTANHSLQKLVLCYKICKMLIYAHAFGLHDVCSKLMQANLDYKSLFFHASSSKLPTAFNLQ
jgi:hypothetical protein